MAPATRISVGDVLDGKYEITNVLGQGAMGVVYAAKHLRLRRAVSLRTLQEDISGNSELVARYEQEARAASAIGHPNIVQVFDAGDVPVPYLVMEHLQGQSLEQRLNQSGPLAPSQAVAVVGQCLGGLAAAHRSGIVHRDLKPENLFIACDESGGKQSVKILDFGISRILDATGGGDGRATQAGMVMGTPLYISPEQTRGLPDIDHRADLWSVACVLYECLAGEPPFGGDNPSQIMASVLDGGYVSLSTRCPSVPAQLSAVLDRALQADVDKRFSSADQFAEALENAAHFAPQADPVEVAAFDNIADRFLAQEAEEAEKAEKTTPTSVPSTDNKPTPPASTGNRFRPPESNAPVALALDIESSVPRREAPASTTTETPTARAKSQWVTRDEPSRLGARIIKLLLFLVVLACVGAGYRYFTQGYILPREAPATASFQLEVEPPEAVFLLGKVKQDSRQVVLEVGKEYQVMVEAEGYLTMRAEIPPTPGQVLTARVKMPLMMPTMHAGVPGAPAGASPVIPELSSAQVSRGYEKLAVLVDCGVRLSSSLQSALPASNEGEPKPVAYNLIDECRLVVEVNAPKKPAIEPLDSASRQLVARIEALNEALRDQQSSAGASSKVRREVRAAVRTASAAARKSRKAWLSAMNQSKSRWLLDDLARTRVREGESLHSQLRGVVVASDVWLRARRARVKSVPTLHEAFAGAYAEALEDAEDRADLYEASGGVLLLQAVAPLLANPLPEDLVSHHNRVVERFNSMVLPLVLDSAAEVGSK
ncbi:MAG: serine/threonine protein kinase [Myxococcales bacterium]|nr:serine/threonine protein kinase [Myxococcales bacterium]